MPPRSNPFFLHRPDGSGVSDPGYRRKAEIGKAESRKRKTGDGGPGSADVLVGRCERIDSNSENSEKRSVRRSAPRPGSATHGYRRPGYETTAQAAKPPL